MYNGNTVSTFNNKHRNCIKENKGINVEYQQVQKTTEYTIVGFHQ